MGKIYQIEIEKRAKLSKAEFDRLEEKMQAQGKLLRSVNRTTLVYIWRDDWQPMPKSSDAPFDLKIRTDESKTSLAVKKDVDENSHSRYEYELKFARDDFAKQLELLVMLGFDRFVMTKLSRKIFKYSGFIVSLDYQHTIDTYVVEVELMAQSEDEVKEKEDQIDGFFREHDLEILTNNETFKILAELNNIEEFRFELKEKDVKSWWDSVVG